MKVLQICNKSPHPAKEGGPIAMNAITRLLQRQGYDVKILAINTPKYSVSPETIDVEYKNTTSIEWVWIDNRIKILDALKSLVKNVSYHVERFKSKAFEEKLVEILTNGKFDVIVLETVYLSVYADIIRKYSDAKLILRAHNVEHTIWKRIAENTSFGLKKVYLSILAKQLESFEKSVISKYDAIWCISNQDAKWFKNQNKKVFIMEIPFGIDVQKLPQKTPEFHLNNLFSFGSMDWYPNKEGIVWFLDNVWNEIHQKYPNLRFKIAGRNMPLHWKQFDYEGVEIVGEVENAMDFWEENGVLIVPLWSGSGVRIKIIEAMAIGKVIITTTIGLEGINAEHKKHILVADTVEEFVNAVSFCMENSQKCQKIGENARKFIVENHNIDTIKIFV